MSTTLPGLDTTLTAAQTLPEMHVVDARLFAGARLYNFCFFVEVQSYYRSCRAEASDKVSLPFCSYLTMGRQVSEMVSGPESVRYTRGRVNKGYRETGSKSSVLSNPCHKVYLFIYISCSGRWKLFLWISRMTTINLSIFGTMFFLSLGEFFSRCLYLVSVSFRQKFRVQLSGFTLYSLRLFKNRECVDN